MNRTLALILIAISVSITTTVITHWLIAPTEAPLVRFDMKGTFDSYQKTLVDSQDDFDVQSRKLNHFATVMKQVLADYQAKTNARIFVDAAVVEGVRDITPEIQRAIIDYYQKEAKS